MVTRSVPSPLQQLEQLLHRCLEVHSALHLAAVVWIDEAHGTPIATTIAQEVRQAVGVIPIRCSQADYAIGHIVAYRQPWNGVTNTTDPAAYPLAPQSRSAYYIPLSRQNRMFAILCLESAEEQALLHPRLPSPIAQLIRQIQSLLESYVNDFAQLATPERFIEFSATIVQNLADFSKHEALLRAVAVTMRHLVKQCASHRVGSALYMKRPMPPVMLRAAEAQTGEFLVLLASSGERLYPPAIIPLYDESGREERPSISLYVLKKKQPRVIQSIDHNGRAQPGNIPALVGHAPYDRGSELNIPLMEGNQAIGNGIVKSPDERAFDDHDGRLVNQYVQACLRIIRRGNGYQIEERDRELAALTLKYDHKIEAIYRDIDPMLDMSDPQAKEPPLHIYENVQRCEDILQDIVVDARQKTGSDVALLALAEGREGQSDELVLNKKDPDSLALSAQGSFRWSLDRGPSLTFAALQQRALIISNDTERDERYFGAIENIRSEVVYPIHSGPGMSDPHTSLGVLDVESSAVEHYTDNHAAILGELGHQVERTLAAFDIAISRWFANEMALIDREIAKMRASTSLIFIQERYQHLLQQLTDSLRTLTAADAVQIYAARSTMSQEGTAYTSSPRLVYVCASPAEMANVEGFRRYIRADEGIAGEVFTTKVRQIFKDRAEREKTKYIPNGIETASEIVRPIFEGDRCVGILNVESIHPYHFTRTRRHITKLASKLAGSIITGFRLCVSELQAKLLEGYQRKLLAHQNREVPRFLAEMCRDLYELTGSFGTIGIRWVQLELTYPSPDHVRSFAFNDESTAWQREEVISPLSQIQPALHEYVTQHGEAALVLDTQENPATPIATPWQEARALICVPLLLADDKTCVGVLSIAARQECTLNDDDRGAVRRFGGSITLALENQALQNARISMLDRLMYDEGRFRQFRQQFDELAGLLRRAKDVGIGAEEIQMANDLIDAIQPAYIPHVRMLNWLMALFENEILAERTSIVSPDTQEHSLQELFAELQTTLEAWCRLNGSHTSVNFPAEPMPAPIAFRYPSRGFRRLKAALFGSLFSAYERTHAYALSRNDPHAAVDVTIVPQAAAIEIALAFASEAPLSQPDLATNITFDNDKVVFAEQYFAACQRSIKHLGGTMTLRQEDATHYILTISIPYQEA
jgi:putative methionine-R-sulfoxide reductase with GAF domain